MRRALFLTALGLIVVAHIVFPKHVQLDWATVALLAVFACVLFWPEFSEALPFVKTLQVGNLKIELREKLERIHQDIEKAEDAAGPVTGKPAMAARDSGSLDLTENFLGVASRDKRIAILQIATEIEKELLGFSRALGVEPPPHTIRETVKLMRSRGILSQEFADAILEFRDVRNKVAHPIRESAVDESVLTSAIDSGVRIVQLLRRLKT